VPRFPKGRIALFSCVGLIGLAAPGGASAATGLGQTFTPTGGAAACGDNRTWLEYAAPSDGTITSWSFQADGAPPQLKFKVGRPTGNPNQFTIVGESNLKIPVAGQLNSYTAQIPVLAGDLIGFYTATMGGCLRGGTTAPTVFQRMAGEATLDGTFAFAPDPAFQLDLSAVFEPTPVTTTPETSITRRPKGKTRKRKARFEFASSEPASSFECSLDGKPFTPCVSPDIFRVKRGKHGFAVRAVGPGGNADQTPATVRWKVRKKNRAR
jgi:hypothetical protein